jgi:hypothetical protein
MSAFTPAAGWLSHLYEHVFLPPHCPAGEIDDSEWEQPGLQLLLGALRSFLPLIAPADHWRIKSAIDALSSFRDSLDSSGYILESKLQEVLLKSKDVPDPFIAAV